MLLLPWSLLLLAHTILASRPAKRFYDTHNYYVLEHDPHTGIPLSDAAKALGVEVVEQAGELANHWLVRVEKPPLNARGEEESDSVLHAYNELRRGAQNLDRRSPLLASTIPFLQRQVLRQPVADRMGIQDPLFTKQWHLVNDEFPEHSMNVTGVWEKFGLTGKGVISSLVDDGLDYTSEDLKDNFDRWDSYDYNDHEELPTPKLSDDHHGTRCAGQVAAVRNTACGVGIAYNSKVAGVRILSGPISDVDEAASLNYGMKNVSIYSCSWGPPDNGKSMEAPGYLIKKAIVNAIYNGRNGLGAIYVFASGNGASHGDHCNADGYTNSIYSVTVSAIDYKGLRPYYSEPCAANMIVAYSSGSGKSIYTTDKGENACASTHGGTSAAAPNAVGVFALALEARPDLTWRDIQYLCVLTARPVNKDDSDWEPTALPGRMYSYKYGFGALDAYEYIKAAQTWQLVKPQVWFRTPTVQVDRGVMPSLEQYSGGRFIPHGGLTSVMKITPAMVKWANLEKLEHINVKVWINHGRRGDVEVDIRSPSGIRSVLGAKRSGDMATTGYPGWTFMSVKHWGEDPVGDWTIKVSDQGSDKFNGTFLGWNMILWGSAIDASKATAQFEVPHDDDDIVFPPHVTPRPSPTMSVATTTKQHSKPTAHLPGDHGTAPGENPNADNAVVVSSGVAASASGKPTAPSTPTADEGWFSDMSNLVKNQAWFFGALGAVVLFSAGAAFFFWRRSRARRRSEYASLPAGDELPMSGLGGRLSSGGGAGARTKELYDAFGEVSDDDEDDANEETRLNARSGYQDIPRGNSSRLDLHDTQYRDEPESQRGSGAASPEAGASDGSWEHATT
ncbi:PHOMO B domain-containing protein [Mycena indigotica]|uniref:PHOMO B domain-containing protein n=1 Tax=Mycena indigotica TaxID=2126181 RepID=A0A8H6W123_9AGAR|nr:PHOMO B domain-containing protein [Mycena indigotica]KAF7295494.1 PHOMO B domain-containing protein [Mycena indigotica]